MDGRKLDSIILLSSSREGNKPSARSRTGPTEGSLRNVHRQGDSSLSAQNDSGVDETYFSKHEKIFFYY